ncbi:sigma-70 family RNA polymerase sigma factor [Streptomyces sp. B1866]|uniref:sigma-70 family RNA polymerase sigma factor n=1 Tax=Streptomyces sp. B1866 TaxID=3075431 RepID=UPI002890AC96|nr:sigma-70 family RNA polymerase sigma factor [Streptomyces sp. B1866]MDT3395246.1 sigma-70 family RNA polymerase sigma factor [Streptomyces sp. B1866]
MKKTVRGSRFPRQRQRVLGVLGSEDTLPPSSHEQWAYLMVNEKSFRRYTRAKAGVEHEDEVFSRGMHSLHTRLKSGPVDNIESYARTVLRNEAKSFLKALAVQREKEILVGEDTFLLGDAAPFVEPVVHTDATQRAEMQRLFELLSPELTEQELTAFALVGLDGLKPWQVAEALDGNITAGTVRQAVFRARRKLAHPSVLARLGISPLPE